MSFAAEARESSTNSDFSSTRPAQQPNSTSSYLSYPVAHVFAGLKRRLTEPPANQLRKSSSQNSSTMRPGAVFTPHRTVSPFQPPPLTPLKLQGGPDHNNLLPRSLAEEVRLLVPPRLQLVDCWRLAYSLERDGASLATLYQKCEEMSHRSQRAGYVLVVKDSTSAGSGNVFGAYMTDAPHPSSHFYGTGECFLWKASILPAISLLQATQAGPLSEDLLELSGLPPPPSADTVNAQRSTTLRADARVKPSTALEPGVTASGSATPDRVRFKAFPYSGINDYMIFCETGFLSVGGG